MRLMPSAFGPSRRITKRDIIAFVGVAAASTISARAQQRAMPVIGYLGSESPEPYTSRISAFLQGLNESGFTQGHNVAIDFQWAEGRYDRLPALARYIASREVAVIVAPGGAEVALAARSATSTIPIVFEMGGDPIALGLVESLSRPGGNLTGVTSLSVEVSHKRLEFLSEFIPTTKTFAVAVNPTSPTSSSQLRNLRRAASDLGLQLHVLHASSEPEIDAMFVAVSHMRMGGLVFTSDPYFAYRSQRLAALAIRHGVPAITQARDFPIAGGLMSYGGDFQQSHRHTGIYAGRVITGERTSDLPVQRVTKLELFVNLKAANALGIAVPASLLSSADVVIE